MISPWLKRLVEALSFDEAFGLSDGRCTVNNFRSGSSLIKKTSKDFDRFTLFVPYASNFLQWEVIFNHSEPDLPPDFIFDSEDFDPDIDRLPSLVNWDARDDFSLCKVVTELFNEYRKFQCGRLAGFHRLQQVYNAVRDLVSEANMEVFIQPPTKKSLTPSASFLIRLNLPIEKIPARLLVSDDDVICLMSVEFPNVDNPQIMKESFRVSPALQLVLGKELVLPLPQADSDLLDYIKDIQEFLTYRIEILDDGLSKRKTYFEAFMVEFESGLAECDTTNYLTASTLINFLDFHFLLCVAMPKHFPDDPPRLLFRSVYHTDKNEKPFTKMVMDYPWSPRWSPEEMMKRLRKYLQETIPAFQRASVMQGVALQPSASAADTDVSNSNSSSS